MIEYPEAMVLARQMDAELRGRKIATCVRGNAPHKFAFYNHEPEEYKTLLEGRTLGGSWAKCNAIMTAVEPDQALILGVGGERILLHKTERTLPKKHQFLLQFTDGDYLSVTIQMWGAIQVTPEAALAAHPFMRNPLPSLMSEEFTYDLFHGLFDTLEPDDKCSVKFFMISKPGLPGLGNGCLHDILFRARLNPRRRVVTMNEQEKEALYTSTIHTVKEIIALGGRDSELDLFGCPGRYMRILHSEMAGKPCPECGSTIEKINYLGGASYFCPHCQV